MSCDNIMLPDTTLIAGSYEEFYNEFRDAANYMVDLTGCEVWWTLAPYSDRTGYTVVKKQAVVEAVNGNYSVARVNINSGDTLNLLGKYVQQWTIVDSENTQHVPAQGLITIIRNIDR